MLCSQSSRGCVLDFNSPPVCELAHTSPQNISRRLSTLGRRRGDRAMAAGDEATICEICKRGRVNKRREEMAFRQWSDKGYIHCRVTILVGTCDNCRAKSLDPGPTRSWTKLSNGNTT